MKEYKVITLVTLICCLFIFLAGCTSKRGRSPEEANEEYQRMLEARDIRIELTQVERAPMDTALLGICRTFFNGDKRIYVNSRVWWLLSEEFKLYVIMHEQAHCTFDIRHTDWTIDGKSPSLMSAKTSSWYNEISIESYWHLVEMAYRGVWVHERE